MAAQSFTPIDELEIYCRSSKKIQLAFLERSIPENGRAIDENAMFEYVIPKSQKSYCFAGRDLLPKDEAETAEKRTYTPKDRFLIGETIFHNEFNEEGIVVDKENGQLSRIMVNFEKSGLKKLVENIGN